MDRTINILVVEDDEAHAALIAHRLRQSGIRANCDVVDNQADLMAALEAKPHDIVLSDYRVPGYIVQDAIAAIREFDPELPVIIVTGTLSEERAADLMRSGARDIVVKSNLARLAPAVEREVAKRSERAGLIRQIAEAERHFRNLVEQSIQGILIGDGKNILFVNEAFCRMFNYTADELMDGFESSALYHPDDRPRIRQHIRARQDGDTTAHRYEVRALRKDGSSFWVEHLTTVVNWHGRRATQIVVLDITDRKEAERQLAENELQYREFFENAPVAMCWMSREGRFIRSNRAFEAMLGYSRDELVQMGPADTIHPKHAKASIRSINEMFTGKSDVVVIENQQVRKDGTAIWVLINAKMLRDPKSGAPYMLAHLQDITARKTAEEQLFHAQKMEALGNLAGGIAHDFNNMLLPIVALTELSKEWLPADHRVQSNLDTVLQAAHQAGQLVKQILTFSRQDQAEVAEFSISQCMTEVITLIRNVLPSSISVIDRIDTNVGTIMGDLAQIQSMVMNLVSNAADAMGGLVGTLKLELAHVVADDALSSDIPGLKANQAYARVTVRDSGSGMDGTTLEKIFNPFFTTKAPGEGTGLGLAMVHGIVERHGGTIAVTSEIGIGTTFDIYLPIHRTRADTSAPDTAVPGSLVRA